MSGNSVAMIAVGILLVGKFAAAVAFAKAWADVETCRCSSSNRRRRGI